MTRGRLAPGVCLIVLSGLLAGCSGPTPGRAPPPPWWKLPTGGTAIDAFTVAHAVYPGDDVPLYVRTQAPSFDVAVRRVGAYGDADSHLVTTRQGVPAISQPPCDPGPDGLLDCGGWRPALHLTVGSWQSGVYILELSTPDGGGTLVPLVVGSREATDFVANIGTFTFEAYNPWGGKSLYRSEPPGQGPARRVSFRRPLDAAVLAHAFGGHSAAVLRWLDATYGARVSYITDFELDRGPPTPAPRALLLVGHDEYMTHAERDHLQAMVDGGGPNLGVLGANDAFWQVRLEAAPDGTERSVLVCYRSRDLDPVADRSLVTIEWRQLGHPASELFGVAYSGLVPHYAVLSTRVVDASDPLFGGMSVKAGDALGQVVGYETDGVADQAKPPPGLRILSAASYAYGSGTAWADATFYQWPSGTRVFAAGSLDWGFGLDPDGPSAHQPSPAIGQLTRNALDALVR